MDLDFKVLPDGEAFTSCVFDLDASLVVRKEDVLFMWEFVVIAYCGIAMDCRREDAFDAEASVSAR